LIIAILLEEFVQGGPVRACCLQIQLEADCGKQLGEFCETQLSGTSIFEGIDRSPANPRLAREHGLAELELLALLGYSATYGD
jgi:hypothetical protein